ncbi:MAG: hypothetical protein PHQ70_09115 [Arcobacter sp.]|uniref:hypothetical protein n=1 Tax=Arcobacter sp. TaxID=1872629 RepID=UPI002586F041|nr:hypothetical protein [Arcobacter sp.]MDD3009013.1 hypothetical protein [Arcobacter sp.]
MKNSFSLFEIILTLIISSIVIIYSTIFTKELILQNKQTQQIEIDKINFLATKIFFEKHKNELDKFSFENNNLYFENNLLLKDVKEFTLNKNLEKISIYINLKNNIIQKWEFNL